MFAPPLFSVRVDLEPFPKSSDAKRSNASIWHRRLVSTNTPGGLFNYKSIKSTVTRHCLSADVYGPVEGRNVDPPQRPSCFVFSSRSADAFGGQGYEILLPSVRGRTRLIVWTTRFSNLCLAIVGVGHGGLPPACFCISFPDQHLPSSQLLPLSRWNSSSGCPRQ